MTAMNPNDGGPYHPTTQQIDGNGEVVMYAYCGASLRDEIAARMLPVIYHEYHAAIARGDHLGDPEWRIGLSLDAYAMADAMLIARARENGA